MLLVPTGSLSDAMTETVFVCCPPPTALAVTVTVVDAPTPIDPRLAVTVPPLCPTLPCSWLPRQRTSRTATGR